MSEKNQSSQVWHVEAVAKYCGVHAITVRAWLRTGRLTGVRIGRKWLINPEGFLKIMSPSSRPSSPSLAVDAEAGAESSATNKKQMPLSTPRIAAEVAALLTAAGWTTRKLRAEGFGTPAATKLLGKAEGLPSVESVDAALALLGFELWYRPRK